MIRRINNGIKAINRTITDIDHYFNPQKQKESEFVIAMSIIDTEKMKKLIEDGMNLDVDLVSLHSPLIYCIQLSANFPQLIETIELLLKYGADVNKPNVSGYIALDTALFWAPNVIPLLLRNGADITLVKPEYLTKNSQNLDELYSLFSSGMIRELQELEYLLRLSQKGYIENFESFNALYNLLCVQNLMFDDLYIPPVSHDSTDDQSSNPILKDMKIHHSEEFEYFKNLVSYCHINMIRNIEECNRLHTLCKDVNTRDFCSHVLLRQGAQEFNELYGLFSSGHIRDFYDHPLSAAADTRWAVYKKHYKSIGQDIISRGSFEDFLKQNIGKDIMPANRLIPHEIYDQEKELYYQNRQQPDVKEGIDHGHSSDPSNSFDTKAEETQEDIPLLAEESENIEG